MQGLWVIRSSPSSSLLPGSLWPELVALDKALSRGKIELTAFLCKTELFELELFNKTEELEIEMFV